MESWIERNIFNSLDNWCYDLEMLWYKKSLWKKIIIFPLILMCGEISNIKKGDKK